MINIFKKHCLFMTLLALTTMTHTNDLQADQRCGYNNSPSFIDNERDYCCLPSPCVKKSTNRFFLTGEVLYWTTHIDGLELNFGDSSIYKLIDSSGVQIFATDETDQDPHFDWKAGYRVAAGYQFACSNLFIGAAWTHFHDKGDRNHNGSDSSFGTTSFGTTTSSIFNQGKCKIKLDQLDVVIGYNSKQDSITFNSFIGVRAAKIKEDLNAHLVTEITLDPTAFDVTSSTFVTETRTFDDDQSFRGIGPLIGVQVGWDIGCGFGIYGNAAASVLYGKYKVHFDDSVIFTDPVDIEIFSQNDRHLHRFTCNLDLGVGIFWQTCICNALQLTMKLGFEHHQYFDHNQLGANRGDLSFDGGVFSINIAL